MTDRSTQDTALVVAELARLPLESAMGKAHLERLAAVGGIEEFPAGALVFAEGEPADVLRIVVGGRIALQVEMPGEGTSVVGTVGRGDLLGWSALRRDARWRTSARAAKVSRCLGFPATAVQDLCDADHELGFHLMRHAYLDLSQRHSDLLMQLLDVYGRS